MSAEDRARVAALPWYHTIDLGGGLVTPGRYDHRGYLQHYGIPEDLHGRTALDIGTASGFFAFELERRGARVTATDLPAWGAHDFAPIYRPDLSPEEAEAYLHQPFELARRLLGSSVERRLLGMAEITPEKVGAFDLVFCGSLLIHLTDPIRALWNMARVTHERAIIATVVMREQSDEPLAMMTGYPRGDTWWAPTRACLELMAATAGFAGVEWLGEFRLDERDGTPGPWHGVLHAWMTTEGWGPGVVPTGELGERRREGRPSPDIAWLREQLAARDQEIAWLRELVRGYERGRIMRLSRRLRRLPGPPIPPAE